MKPTTMLLYGATGSSKTTQLRFIAELVWRLFKRQTRLVSADSGWEPMGDLVQRVGKLDLPVAEPIDLRKFKRPGSVLMALAHGHWLTLEKEKLVFEKAPKLDEIGCYMFEGLDSFAELYMTDLVQQGRYISNDIPAKFDEVVELENNQSLKVTHAAPGRTHYLRTQKFILEEFVPIASGLQVPLVVFTAHESRGEDDVTSKAAVGPAVVGKALVKRTSEKFGHAIHLDPLSESGKPLAYRAFFQPHPDNEVRGLTWDAKLSCLPERSRKLLQQHPSGFIPLDLNVGIGQLVEDLLKDAGKVVAGQAK